MDEKMRHELATELTKIAADKGKLIALGWLGYREMVLDPHCPEVQLQETRIAFYAGAQHTFTSVMNILDPGEEPTDADMARMTSLSDELMAFAKAFQAAAEAANRREATGTGRSS